MESVAWWRIWVVVGGALGIFGAVVLSLVPVLRCGQEWGDLSLNLGSELVGAVMTYALFEVFIGGQLRREAKKTDLIGKMGSRVRDVAVAAADELRREGWLTDGTLRGVKLSGADLQEVDLSDADLQEVDLSDAKLRGANLSGANLQGASLFDVNLQGASLVQASLREADLWYADLQEADLKDANLYGAVLWDANLYEAELGRAWYLDEASFNNTTRLPDGTYWTPDTDMTRFTDFPEMPNWTD